MATTAPRLAFYHGHGSPFAWRVFLGLEYKGVPYDRRTISFDRRDTRQPEFLRMNPRGKVPLVVDGDFVLYESAAIVEYLDERFPDAPRLIPGDLRQRAIVRRLVREIDHYFGAPVQALARELFTRSAEQRDDAAIAASAAALHTELAHLERTLAGEYVAHALSAADFALYPLAATLARFDLRYPTLELAAKIPPRLAAWMKRIEALPYFAKTYPEHWR